MRTKIYSLLMFLFFAMGAAVVLQSCGDDDVEEIKPENDWGSLKNNGFAGTGAAVDITPHYATIQCSINPDYGPAYVDYEVDYSVDPTLNTGWRTLRNSGLINGKHFKAYLEDLSPNTKYYYQTRVEVGKMTYYGDIRSFTTSELNIITSGYVDFGYCGRWAACNLGASSPEDLGGLYDPFPFDLANIKNKQQACSLINYLNSIYDENMVHYYGNTMKKNPYYWTGTQYDPAYKYNKALRTPYSSDYSGLITYSYDHGVYTDFIKYKGVDGVALSPKDDDSKTIFIPCGEYISPYFYYVDPRDRRDNGKYITLDGGTFKLTSEGLESWYAFFWEYDTQTGESGLREDRFPQGHIRPIYVN